LGAWGRQERFELLAGVVDLLGGGLGEDRPPGKLAPFGCLYGPLSAERRGAFLERLQSWPERVRRRALAAVSCFRSAPHEVIKRASRKPEAPCDPGRKG
jgi:hypothetical protein